MFNGINFSALVKHYLESGLNRKKVSICPTFPKAITIPKIIHQTIGDKITDLPVQIQTNIDELKNRNPGWEYRLYDDDDIVEFISINYGDIILRYYENISSKYGAARADLFRYLLLYRFGGVYLDIKSTSVKKLDEIIKDDDEYLLSQWKNRMGEEEQGRGIHQDHLHIPGGDFQQWHIVCVPGHPFLHAVIEAVLSNIDNYNPGLHGTGLSTVLKVTGPIAYTLAIFPLLPMHKHRFIDYDEYLGFKYSIFYTDKSKFEHRKLFSTHYSTLDESLIKLGTIRKLTAQCLMLCKRIYFFVTRQ